MTAKATKTSLFFYVVTQIPSIGMFIEFATYDDAHFFWQMMSIYLVNTAWFISILVIHTKKYADRWGEVTDRRFWGVFFAFVTIVVIPLAASTFLVEAAETNELAWQQVLQGLISCVVGVSALFFWPVKNPREQTSAELENGGSGK